MELGAKIRSEEEGSSETLPDIHELFRHYNSLYFDDALGACIVSWSDSRTTRSAGKFCYVEGGGCEIRLSKPLLKFRSTADLKKTLLHEMIHAFLYVRSNMRDHSYHGLSFSAIMNVINSSSKTDPQRPPNGYNITFSHDLSKGVDSYRVQQWTCTSCGDMIEGPTNREPSANDCIENIADYNSCGNLSCHWHRHKMLCSGRYTKTTGKLGYKDKMWVSKDVQENERDKSKRSSPATRRTKKGSQNVEQMIESSSVKMLNTVDDVRKSSGIKSPSCGTKRSKRSVTMKQLKATPLQTEDDALTSRIHKRPRTTGFFKVNKSDSPKKENFPKHKEEIPVDGQWFAIYTDEETDEDIKPLVNKRTERRKREKLAELKRRFPDAVAVDVACSSQNEGRNWPSKALAYRKEGHDAPPLEDNVIYILDD